LLMNHSRLGSALCMSGLTKYEYVFHFCTVKFSPRPPNVRNTIQNLVSQAQRWRVPQNQLRNQLRNEYFTTSPNLFPDYSNAESVRSQTGFSNSCQMLDRLYEFFSLLLRIREYLGSRRVNKP